MSDASRIDDYLKQHRSPLAGLGAEFINAGRRYGVDPYLLVAISGAESSYGKHINGSYNPFGWGPGIHFNSWGQAINAVASGLKKGYYDQGRKTIAAIGAKWAPIGASNDPTGLNNNWVKNVSSLYKQLSGGQVNAQASPSQAAREAPAASISAPDLSQFAFQQLSGQSRGQNTLQQLAMSVAMQQNAMLGGQPQQPAAVKQVTPQAGSVTVAKGADRAGIETGAGILAFAHQVSAVLGSPLRITTGTNHSKMTVNGRQSAHWTGRAADIAASGVRLTQMGRAALIAAGMDPQKAAREKGGLYNIGGYQIIFNTRQGGNHWNHLHIGLRG